MKALTVSQPHAALLLLPDTDPRHKRIENRRRWAYKYRGVLLIHEKERQWTR